jgi:hypothetical protein
MKHILVVTLVLVVAAPQGVPAIERHKAAYAGGTIARFNAEGGRIGGRVDTSDPDRLVFVADERPLSDMPLRVEYGAIHHIEFGQNARRRLNAAIGATALLGPIGLVALRSKHRTHYLTVTYRDDVGVNQVIVLQLGKSVVRDTLAVIEAKSGKAIEFQDEEARKWST